MKNAELEAGAGRARSGQARDERRCRWRRKPRSLEGRQRIAARGSPWTYRADFVHVPLRWLLEDANWNRTWRRKSRRSTSCSRRPVRPCCGRVLAAWMTGPEESAAREVAVNHLWSRHTSVDRSPRSSTSWPQGDPADSSRASSDWLAVELIEHGLATKSHPSADRRCLEHDRLLVASSLRTPKKRSRPIPRTDSTGGRTRSRMEFGEIVRDSLLSLSGDLRPGLAAAC